MAGNLAIRDLGKTDAWRIEHMRTIGGSMAASVVGRGRWTSPRELWHQMRAVIVDGRTPPELPMTDHMRRGLLREHDALMRLAELIGEEIKPHEQGDFIYHPEFPWAHSLPDGVIVGKPREISEAKVPLPGTIATCNREGLLSAWHIQCQHNLAVCDADICHVSLLDPISELASYFRVERDDVFIDRLMLAERDFHQSILDGDEPTEELADAVEMDPEPAGMIHLETDEAEELVRTWFRLRELEADLSDSLGQVKNKLQALIGDAPVAEIGELARIWWKPAKPSRSLNRAAVLAKYPDIEHDATFWTHRAPARPFRVYELNRA